MLLSRSLLRRGRRAFLLPIGLLMLSTAVFGWGLQYKLSLYQGKDSISHLMPEAKLLSQKERPAAVQLLSARPLELTALRFFPALLMVMVASGWSQPSARHVRTGSLERSRRLWPPCLQAIFFRPPPVLA